VSNPKTPTSKRSSSRSGTARYRRRPAIVLRLRASTRLQVLWLIWCAALSGALLFGLGANLFIRIPLVGLIVWLAYRGIRALRHPGRGLVRLSWGSDGRWQAQDGLGRLHYVELETAPQCFGPLLWMRLRAAGWCETVLIDGLTMEPVMLAALKARLRLDQGS
jgi:hypothetical protein